MWGWEDVTHEVGVDIALTYLLTFEQYGLVCPVSGHQSDPQGKALCSPSNLSDHKTTGSRASSPEREKPMPMAFSTSREEWVWGHDRPPVAASLGTDRRNRWWAEPLGHGCGWVRSSNAGDPEQTLSGGFQMFKQLPLRHNYWSTWSPELHCWVRWLRAAVRKRSHRKGEPADETNRVQPRPRQPEKALSSKDPVQISNAQMYICIQNKCPGRWQKSNKSAHGIQAAGLHGDPVASSASHSLCGSSRTRGTRSRLPGMLGVWMGISLCYPLAVGERGSWALRPRTTRRPGRSS